MQYLYLNKYLPIIGYENQEFLAITTLIVSEMLLHFETINYFNIQHTL